MVVTLLGIVTEVKSGQLAKAFAAIPVTLYSTLFLITDDGITISPVYWWSLAQRATSAVLSLEFKL